VPGSPRPTPACCSDPVAWLCLSVLRAHEPIAHHRFLPVQASLVNLMVHSKLYEIATNLASRENRSSCQLVERWFGQGFTIGVAMLEGEPGSLLLSLYTVLYQRETHVIGDVLRSAPPTDCGPVRAKPFKYRTDHHRVQFGTSPADDSRYGLSQTQQRAHLAKARRHPPHGGHRIAFTTPTLAEPDRCDQPRLEHWPRA
jgi:hypothetical protein